MPSPRETTLLRIYATMSARLGPSRWWPGDSPFEVAVGAVLTQNTVWRNVEKALERLKEKDALTPLTLWRLPVAGLEEALRPSGYYRLKAARLRNLLEYFARTAGRDAPPDDATLAFLRDRETDELREGLLGVRGVGPETADSILLYALNRPTFVGDAYTRRMFSRHGLLPEDVAYDEMRDFFMDVLPPDAALFNEYHALIVRTGNTFCKKSRPLCGDCPLGELLEHAVA